MNRITSIRALKTPNQTLPSAKSDTSSLDNTINSTAAGASYKVKSSSYLSNLRYVMKNRLQTVDTSNIEVFRDSKM